MVVAWTYAFAVNWVPAYKETVDKVGESTVGLQDGSSKDEESIVGAAGEKDEGSVHVERQL